MTFDLRPLTQLITLSIWSHVRNVPSNPFTSPKKDRENTKEKTSTDQENETDTQKLKWCALVQIALIAVLIGHSNGTRAGPDLVGHGGGCSCMLLVQPTSTCPDAAPSVLQLVLVVFSFHQLA